MASREELRAALTAAMKGRDEVTTSALRMTLAAISQAEAAGAQRRALTEDEIQAVLSREAKRREEAAEAFRAAGRPDRAERELAERDVLATFLPAPLSPAELEAIVVDVLRTGEFRGVASMGQAMRVVMERVRGRADGKAVSELVRSRLSTTG